VRALKIDTAQRSRGIRIFFLVFFALAILVGCLIPDPYPWKIYKSMPYIRSLIESIFSSKAQFLNFVHALGFVVLTPLALVTLRRPVWQVVLLVSVFAAIAEMFQWFVPSRSANFGDIGRNLLGVLIGTLIHYYFKRAIRVPVDTSLSQ
jgi:VanZ family protein